MLGKDLCTVIACFLSSACSVPLVQIGTGHLDWSHYLVDEFALNLTVYIFVPIGNIIRGGDGSLIETGKNIYKQKTKSTVFFNLSSWRTSTSFLIYHGGFLEKKP